MLTNQSGSPLSAWDLTSCQISRRARSARATSMSRAIAASRTDNSVDGRVPYRLAA